MAKKKSKKNQKTADWTSPPPSPNPVPGEPPLVPAENPLSDETTATGTLHDDFQSVTSPPQSRHDDSSSDIRTATPSVPDSSSTISEAAKQAVEREISLQTSNEDDQKEDPPTDFGVSTESSHLSAGSGKSEEHPITDATPLEPVAPSQAPEPESIATAEQKQAELEEPPEELPLLEKPETGSCPTVEEATPSAQESKPVLEPISLASTHNRVTEEPQLSTTPPPLDSTIERFPEPEVTRERPVTSEAVTESSEARSKPKPAIEKPAVQSSCEPGTQPVSSVSTAIPTSRPAQPTSFSTPAPPIPATVEDTVQGKPSPRPEAVKQVLEDSRPPAPTPPVTRARPRHSSAYEDDEDEDDPLIQPPRRGENLSRDLSRGLTYPPQPSHSRLFASRVPSEHYSPPPPQPPPGYHPRYYPTGPQPGAPPYYHANSMSQPGGFPNGSPYGPSSHSSSPYQETWSQYPPAYPPYGSPPVQRHDSFGSREYTMGPLSLENNSAVEDDTVDIFSRISQAIPDLHVLLARYKETHGQLGVREELLRRASAEQQDKLRSKDNEIKNLEGKIAALEMKHSGEASKLRLEIGNMEEQMRELREQIAETDRLKKEAEETRTSLNVAKTSWESKQRELESANFMLENTIEKERQQTQRDFEEWKTTTTTRHDAEKIALAIQFDKKLKEADVLADNQRQEAAAAFIKEKDELRSEHQRQQREREANFDRVREELETKLSTAQKDREEALKQERESREIWMAERATLLKSHQKDRDSLRRGFDEQRQLVEVQHKKIKEDSDKAWIELHAEANRRAEDEKAKVISLTKERDGLQQKIDELMAKQEEQKRIASTIKENLSSEKARLEKLMECYGDVAEIKSKGDTYYLVSFSQLQKQIIDLATTHFIHLPVSPPPEDLAQIPSGLPSFLGDTPASRQLRAAYIVHTVSKMVTYRVFGPFLFSLGRRYDKADSLFLSMSNHIREKSTRKEAIWRQQTLVAAFTSSGAKQRINTAAGTVVDEIVGAIKNFADPREEEGIRIAVRRIVKLAAETWRFARLEREMITATMPALHDEEHAFNGPDFWPAYKAEDTPIPSLIGAASELDKRSNLLLRLFPVITREPKHENLRFTDEEKADEGCIYHYGLALYDDAKPVVARIGELKAAGLPPVASNVSSTSADFPEAFPPPLIPPPRNPLPPTPRTPNETPLLPSPPVEALDRHSLPVPTPQEPPRSPTTRAIPVPTKSESGPIADPPQTVRTEIDTANLLPTTRSRVSESPSLRVSTESAILPAPSASPEPKTPPPPPEVPAQPTSIDSAQPTKAPIPYTRPIPVPLEPDSSDVANKATPGDESDSPPPRSSVSDAQAASTPTESNVILPTAEPGQSSHSQATSVIDNPAPPSSTHQPHIDIAPLPASAPNDIAPPIPTTTREPAPTDANNSLRQERPPTPPHSRAATPTSPLFAAIDEIEGLRNYTARRASQSRRSTPAKSSNEELRKEHGDDTARRTSGYTLSNKSSTDGGASQRSSASRYTCESRSAAIKALYPNGPLAGQPVLRSQKHRSIQSAKDDGTALDTSSHQSV